MFPTTLQKIPLASIKYEHYIADGIYYRRMFLQAGYLYCGVVHKRECASVLLKGSLKIFMADRFEEPARIVTVGAFSVSPQGTQRAVFALEDSEFMTIHRAVSDSIEENIRALTDAPEVSGVYTGLYHRYEEGIEVEKRKLTRTVADIGGKLQHISAVKARVLQESGFGSVHTHDNTV